MPSVRETYHPVALKLSARYYARRHNTCRLNQPPADIGGKGLFTKEIDDALLNGTVTLTQVILMLARDTYHSPATLKL
jgi:hypothetical protein